METSTIVIGTGAALATVVATPFALAAIGGGLSAAALTGALAKIGSIFGGVVANNMVTGIVATTSAPLATGGTAAVTSELVTRKPTRRRRK